MEVQNKIEKFLGTASTLKADEFILEYAERVEKFLRDNNKLGDNWMKNVASKLYCIGSCHGNVLGGPYIAGFISTYCPEIPPITGQNLKELIKNTNNKTLFAPFYVDFGVQVNGRPKENRIQAKAFLDDYESRGIDNKKILVPNYNQLILAPSRDCGLIFKLKEGISQKDLALVSDYNIKGEGIGRDGFYRVLLGSSGNWCANDGDLWDSDGEGVMVRYDAEGIEPKKFNIPQKKDLASIFKSDFLRDLSMNSN